MFYVTATKSLFSIRIAKIGSLSIKSKLKTLKALNIELVPVIKTL